MENTNVPTPVRKTNKNGKIKSAIWWLRKKVPQRFRAAGGGIPSDVDFLNREVGLFLDQIEASTASKP